MSSFEAHDGPGGSAGGFAGGFAAEVAAAVRLAEAQLQRPVVLRVVRDGQATEPIAKPGRRGQPPEIRYGSYLDGAPPQVRRWAAAHEVAHVVLGHVDKSFPTWLYYFNAVIVVALGPAAAIAASNLTGELGYIALIPLYAILAALIYLAVDGGIRRARERAADDWATRLVGPMSDADRDWQKRHDGRPLDPRPPGQGPTEWTPMMFRTHPRWDTRGVCRATGNDFFQPDKGRRGSACTHPPPE